MIKIKKVFFVFLLSSFFCQLMAQNYYYVFLTDKKDVKINPEGFFDQKAIERRIKCGINLYDESDFPVNESYKMQIKSLSEDYVGESRWFNMLMLSASDENINIIRDFSFVKDVVLLEKTVPMQIAEKEGIKQIELLEKEIFSSKLFLSKQLQRMGGEYFLNNNINGKGVRIAVFDAGFTSVDKHIAFEHLRKNGQIKKTWNFPSKKENVYGWDGHGTMVLSCIAGIKISYDKENGNEDKTLLGLAMGADFLLARTEVNTEPKKEEFWWLQAVEWADKNGADIINSSLGYGKQRYDYTEMNGTSLVAKAANMAAKKGILVCNSAGNEGNDNSWRILVTPADADSVITVGGIINDLHNYRKISFSSYGPTADGRKKPNLVNFGEAEVASPQNATKYQSVFGTSFSSPLTAGFAACALQTNPMLTAVELKTEMEKSADLYPYFDYAFGYGVPQAKYFVEKEKSKEIIPSFTIEEIDDNRDKTNKRGLIKITILNYKAQENNNYLWYNIQNDDKKETLDYYTQINVDYCSSYDISSTSDSFNETTIKEIIIDKRILKANQKINIFYKNYFLTYIPKNINNETFDESIYLSEHGGKASNIAKTLSINVKNQEKNISNWGNFAKNNITGYFSFSMFIPKTSFENNFPIKYGKSLEFNFGIRYKYNICYWYSLGSSLEIGGQSFALSNNLLNFEPATLQNTNYKIEKNKYTTFKINFEIFQRFNFLRGGMGCLFLDLGVYGGFSSLGRVNQKILFKDSKISLNKNQKINNELLNYGIKARFGYSWIALFAQYKIANTYYNKECFFIPLPKLSIGIELILPL